MRSPARLLFVSQLCLSIGLFVCVLLMPHFLFESNEGGVSNYGTYTKTVIPYTFGFGICGILTLRVARISTNRMMHRLLWILGLLYLFVLISTYPYKLDATYDNIHHAAGASLLIYSLGFGMWLSLFRARSIATIALFTAQLIGFLMAILTSLGVLHVLFIAELLSSLAFGVLLTVATAVTEVRHRPIG